MAAAKPKRRLKSTSKGGQSLKSRANESKGSRKAELDKLTKAYTNETLGFEKKIDVSK